MAMIDDYCKVPSGFFLAGGTTITEIVDITYGLHPGYYINTPTYYPYPYQLTARLRNWPVISMQHCYVNINGYGQPPSWLEIDGDDDLGNHFPAGDTNPQKCFLQTVQGRIVLVNAVSARYYQGLKATYQAGYAATPNSVWDVCIKLATNMLHVIIQKVLAPIIKVDDWVVKMVIPDVFTPELKKELTQYHRAMFLT